MLRRIMPAALVKLCGKTWLHFLETKQSLLAFLIVKGRVIADDFFHVIWNMRRFLDCEQNMAGCRLPCIQFKNHFP